jgi:hypothetical protein
MEQAIALAKNDVQDILTLNEAPNGQRYTEQISKDLTSLEKRKDIPEPIRKLMGEYTDPVTTFAISISKLATLHSQAELLNRLQKKFTGSLFFEKDDPNRPEGFNHEVAASGSQTWSPLNGMYTNKVVMDALKENIESAPAWYRLYQKGFGMVQAR